jgi:hypothetical protein
MGNCYMHDLDLLIISHSMRSGCRSKSVHIRAAFLRHSQKGRKLSTKKGNELSDLHNASLKCQQHNRSLKQFTKCQNKPPRVRSITANIKHLPTNFGGSLLGTFLTPTENCCPPHPTSKNTIALAFLKAAWLQIPYWVHFTLKVQNPMYVHFHLINKQLIGISLSRCHRQ